MYKKCMRDPRNDSAASTIQTIDMINGLHVIDEFVLNVQSQRFVEMPLPDNVLINICTIADRIRYPLIRVLLRLQIS